MKYKNKIMLIILAFVLCTLLFLLFRESGITKSNIILPEYGLSPIKYNSGEKNLNGVDQKLQEKNIIGPVLPADFSIVQKLDSSSQKKEHYIVAKNALDKNFDFDSLISLSQYMKDQGEYAYIDISFLNTIENGDTFEIQLGDNFYSAIVTELVRKTENKGGNVEFLLKSEYYNGYLVAGTEPDGSATYGTFYIESTDGVNQSIQSEFNHKGEIIYVDRYKHEQATNKNLIY